MQLMRTGKSQYSETEAAEELGISVMQLRTMIRSSRGGTGRRLK
ncbi:MAG: hypothetical protein WDO18_23010 [Acidobacteriota bacterium]